MCDDAAMAADRASDDPALAPPHGASAGARADVSERLAGLLDEIGRGDREAFAEFYSVTGRRVYGLAMRILRRPALAEEVAQEVFVQVWTTADRYSAAAGTPLGWLMTLTHRRSVDRVRSERAAADRDRNYAHTQLVRDHDSVSEQVAQTLEEQAVARCLDSLTDAQRDTIDLTFYGGHTYREVAEDLGMPLPTVKSRIRDGLIRLKKCLGVDTDG
jgi:RNA polymerase sigma-70 factor (ECF subfamily)